VEKTFPRNVFLCGFMATGKSSVGRQLAQLLKYEFVDMDALIEAEAGMTIPDIFATKGEAVFRSMESDLIDRLAPGTGRVVATGGGAVVNPRNLDAIKQSGALITLTADPRIILSRVGSAEDRPMLAGENKEERIRNLLKAREHAYAQADITVDTSSLSIDQVARAIFDSLQHRFRKHEPF
jgi:shikimate kinase